MMRQLSTLAALLLGASLAFAGPVSAQDEESDYSSDGFEEAFPEDFDGGSEDEGSAEDAVSDSADADEEADPADGGDEETDSADGGDEDFSGDSGEEFAGDEDFSDDSGEEFAGDEESVDEESGTEEGDVAEDSDGDSWDDDSWEEEDTDVTEVGTVDVALEEEEEEEPQAPWHLYGGAGMAVTTMSLSTLPPDAENDFDTSIYRARVGVQLFNHIDVEVQVGAGQDAQAAGEVTTDSFYGAFIVPSTNVADLFELAFPVGYARTTVEEEEFSSPAFGISLEVPLRFYAESMPDIRVTAGWMTYYQDEDARLYGFNVGLRYDFNVGGDPDWEPGW